MGKLVVCPFSVCHCRGVFYADTPIKYSRVIKSNVYNSSNATCNVCIHVIMDIF